MPRVIQKNKQLLTDPYNPLGFPESCPSFDDPDKACTDFHLTLAWIFWRPCIILDHHDNFVYVRHLRHLLLNTLEKRTHNGNVLRVGDVYYHVESGQSSQCVILILSRLGTDSLKDKSIPNGVHIIARKSINDEAIQKAIRLNAELDVISITPEISLSPFGPADVVMPPDCIMNHSKGVVVMPSKPKYRQIRLFPESFSGSRFFESSVTSLSRLNTVSQVALFLNKVALLEMTPEELKRFFYMCAQKIQELIKLNLRT